MFANVIAVFTEVEALAAAVGITPAQLLAVGPKIFHDAVSGAGAAVIVADLAQLFGLKVS